MGLLGGLSFPEQSTLVIVEGGVFREDRVVLKVGEPAAAADRDTLFVGATTHEPKELHRATLILRDFVLILRRQWGERGVTGRFWERQTQREITTGRFVSRNRANSSVTSGDILA